MLNVPHNRALAKFQNSWTAVQHVGSDVSQWTPLLKDDYEPAIRNELAEDNQILSFMESEIPDETWQGAAKIAPLKIGRNWSVGSMPVGTAGYLPIAGRSVWARFEIPMRSFYGRVQFERWVIEQSRNKKGSWQQVIPTEMEGLVNDLSFTRNRAAWGYGAGILALVNGAVAAGSATVNVDAPGNVAGSSNGNRYLHGDSTSGQVIAFLNPATNAIEHYATISGRPNMTSITINPVAPAGGITDNAKIVLAQRPTQTSFNNEPEGLMAGIDDGTYVDNYHGLSRSTYEILRSYIVTGVGSFSVDAVQQCVDAQAIRVGAHKTDVLGVETGIRRAYTASMEIDRRYTGANLMRPDGGTVSLKKPTGRDTTVGDIPMLVDRDAPYGMVFGINKASFTRYVMNDGEWAADNGDVLKWVQEMDSYTAYYYMFENWHCHYPNRNFRMEGVNQTVLAVHSF